EDAREHDRATQEGIEQELPGGILAAQPTPNSNEQKHGDEFHFPEEEEEDKVQRREDTHHTCFQQEDEGHIVFGALFNVPRANDGQEAEQAIEDNHRQAEAISPQEIVNFELGVAA